MMKVKALLFINLIALSLSASAQFAQFANMKATTREECIRRCNRGIADSNPKKIQHDAVMKELAEKKKVEKDPVKLKQLTSDEEEETEGFKDERAESCHRICQHNPEN